MQLKSCKTFKLPILKVLENTQYLQFLVRPNKIMHQQFLTKDLDKIL